MLLQTYVTEKNVYGSKMRYKVKKVKKSGGKKETEELMGWDKMQMSVLATVYATLLCERGSDSF